MAEFVRAQIFGTTFEITSRCLFPNSPHNFLGFVDAETGTPTYNLWGWEPLDLSGIYTLQVKYESFLPMLYLS